MRISFNGGVTGLCIKRAIPFHGVEWERGNADRVAVLYVAFKRKRRLRSAGRIMKRHVCREVKPRSISEGFERLDVQHLLMVSGLRPVAGFNQPAAILHTSWSCSSG